MIYFNYFLLKNIEKWGKNMDEFYSGRVQFRGIFSFMQDPDNLQPDPQPRIGTQYLTETGHKRVDTKSLYCSKLFSLCNFVVKLFDLRRAIFLENYTAFPLSKTYFQRNILCRQEFKFHLKSSTIQLILSSISKRNK